MKAGGTFGQGRGRRARLTDVAAEAGVSLGSASRALSNPQAVRAATLTKVREAADRLGYVADGVGRALALGRSNTLGLLVPTLTNPIYAAFAHGAQRRADAAGRQLLITADEYDRARGPEHARRLVERGVDGMILIGADHHPGVLAAIEARGTPHVFAWSFDEARGRGCVGISNARAVARIVRHLLDLGHRRFGVLSGVPTYNERARSRLEGVRVALADAALLGIAVPAALSVTGFDDVDYAALLNPPLTTVRVPAEAMGARAVETLLETLGSGATPPDIEFGADLVLRGSTGLAPR